jgi:hypothetical protein
MLLLGEALPPADGLGGGPAESEWPYTGDAGRRYVREELLDRRDSAR